MDSRTKRRVRLRIGLAFVLFFATIFLLKQTVGLAAIKNTVPTAHMKSGVSRGQTFDQVVVRSGPGDGFEKLGTLKSKTKVRVYATKNGWAEIHYHTKKAYVPVQSLRFYSDFSAVKAQKITDSLIAKQRATWEKSFTKEQLYSMLSDSFTKDYIDRYFKQLFRPAGKTASGTPLYHIVETEIYGYAIDRFDWTAKQDPEPPTVIHYIQDGKEYLVVSQYHLNEESGNHLSTLFLSKATAPDHWKVYNYTTSY